MTLLVLFVMLACAKKEEEVITEKTEKILPIQQNLRKTTLAKIFLQNKVFYGNKKSLPYSRPFLFPVLFFPT